MRENYFNILLDDYRTIELFQGSPDIELNSDVENAWKEIKLLYECYTEVVPDPESFESAIKSLKKCIKKGA